MIFNRTWGPGSSVSFCIVSLYQPFGGLQPHPGEKCGLVALPKRPLLGYSGPIRHRGP